MPKYTSRVSILRRTKFFEEIWFEDIRASSENNARHKTSTQAIAYLKQQQGSMNPPDGFSIELCCRTALLEKKVKEGDKAALMLPKPQNGVTDSTRQNNTKHVNKVLPARIKISENKFKDELMGDFHDPFEFAKPLRLHIRQIGYPVNNHNHGGRRNNWGFF